MTLIRKLGWIAAAALGLFVVATFAGIVSAGPLDPTAPPASTQRTQNDLVPAWHQTLSSTGGCNSERFDCVMSSDVAVLDRETGLVWQRVPSTFLTNWADALTNCAASTTGARRGWRLPTHHELLSLFTFTGLPAGHPFTPPSANVWSASTSTANAADALLWVTTSSAPGSAAKTNNYAFWCVRGSGGYGAY